MKSSINISFISKDKKQLGTLQKELSASKDIDIQQMTLESIPGAIETLSVLGVTIAIAGGVVSQLAGAFLYDLLKKKGKDTVEVFVEGNRVSSKEEIIQLLEIPQQKKKKIKTEKKKEGKKDKKMKKEKKTK